MKVNLYYDKHDDNYYFRLNNKRLIINAEEFIFLKKVFDLFCNYQNLFDEIILTEECEKRGKRR